MLKRILVAAIGIPVILALILFCPLWAVGAAIGLIAAFSAYELYHCAEPESPRYAWALPVISAFAIPFLTAFCDLQSVAFTALFFVLLLTVCAQIYRYERRDENVSIQKITLPLLCGVIMPALLSSVVMLGKTKHPACMMLLPFIVAFCSDAGGYFVGGKFGKHLLVPGVSPHKTLEGSIGGFCASILAAIIYAFILLRFGFHVHFELLCAYAFLGSLACQIGDLCFSLLKRLLGVKDYSKLLPGHGGMLDRFDSMYFTAPALYLLICFVSFLR